MKTNRKIPIVCLQLLLILGLLLGTQATVKADQFDEALAASKAGNDQKAFELYKSLGEQGNAKAQVNVGLLYYHGDGVPQDYTESLRWFKMAAQLFLWPFRGYLQVNFLTN